MHLGFSSKEAALLENRFDFQFDLHQLLEILSVVLNQPNRTRSYRLDHQDPASRKSRLSPLGNDWNNEDVSNRNGKKPSGNFLEKPSNKTFVNPCVLSLLVVHENNLLLSIAPATRTRRPEPFHVCNQDNVHFFFSVFLFF